MRTGKILRLVHAAALALAGLLAAGCTAQFEDLARRESPPAASARCGQCHADVYREWFDSPHARAFVSPQFLSRTDGGSVERCLSCHAPDDIPPSPGRPLSARAMGREEGVHCAACHRLPPGHGGEGSAMAGPLASEALVQPHTVRAMESWYRDPAFCGRCHEDTLAEWRAAPPALSRAGVSKPACQDCHMPAVERKVTQASGLLSGALVLFEGTHRLRSHRFSAAAGALEAPEVLGGEFFELSAMAGPERLQIELKSLLLHDLPTGGFGGRRAIVRLLLDEEWIELRSLRVQRGESLPAGGTLRLEAPLPRHSREAALEVVRETAEGPPLVIWRRDFQVELPAPAPEPPVTALSPPPPERKAP